MQRYEPMLSAQEHPRSLLFSCSSKLPILIGWMGTSVLIKKKGFLLNLIFANVKNVGQCHEIKHATAHLALMILRRCWDSTTSVELGLWWTTSSRTKVWSHQWYSTHPVTSSDPEVAERRSDVRDVPLQLPESPEKEINVENFNLK